MQPNLTKLMRQTAPHAPAAHLRHDVMDAVFAARRRDLLIKRLPFMIAGLIASLAGAVYAFVEAWRDAVSAGLPEFVSAAFSDTGTVLASWQAYLLALADTIPLLPIAAVCGALSVFLLLLRRTDRLVAPHSHHLTHA